MPTELIPLGARLLIRPRPYAEKVGSLFVPNRREYAIEAEVLSIGDEVRDIQVGDIVLVPAAVGQDVGGDRLVPESSVLGTV